MPIRNLVTGALFLVMLASAARAIHIIKVVDDQTNRGVPMVELTTTNNVKWITDSNGIVAFDEPGLMDREMWFNIKSHGYEFTKDPFGYRGTRVNTKQGATTTLKIKRINIAQRLYRITGQGIYGESIKAGITPPIEQPALNADVMGQDSVQTIEYRGKLRWFWGDTNAVRYPLGLFATSGATSELPSKGGLDPSVGVNLKYFAGENGFSRAMVDLAPAKKEKPPGAIWIGGLMVLKDDKGEERMVAAYTRVKDLGTRLGRGLIVYNDKTDVFEQIVETDKDEEMLPNGLPVRITDKGVEYFYFPAPYAVTRVKADWKSVTNPREYESLTPLKQGTHIVKDKAPAQLERDAAGKLVWAWKKDTGPLRENDQKDLIKAGAMKESEAFYDLKDAESGKAVLNHGGTIAWNEYRKKYIMIFVEIYGSSSLLGEVWCSESDKIDGPFRKARKIATHEKQTFYNAWHHPEFDQQGGRVIYFEGTYCNTFSGNPDQTPRYDYNQIMYQLDLGDPRLKLE